MIVKHTITLIFEYPQDYLQEQEWCKTKGDRWIHKSTDTLCSVYENQISYSIGASAKVQTDPQMERHLPDYSYEADLGRRIMEQTDCSWK